MPPDNRADVQKLLGDLKEKAKAHGIGFIDFALSFPSPVKWSATALQAWDEAGCGHAEKVALAVQEQLQTFGRCCVLVWEDLHQQDDDEDEQIEISAHVSLLFITGVEDMVIVRDDPFMPHHNQSIAVEGLRVLLNTEEHHYLVVNVFGNQQLEESDCVERVGSRLKNFKLFQEDMERAISRAVLPGGKKKKNKSATIKTVLAASSAPWASAKTRAQLDEGCDIAQNPRMSAIQAMIVRGQASTPLTRRRQRVMVGKRKRKYSGIDLLVESAVAAEPVKLKKKKRRKKGAHKDKSGRECD